jgi:hypothetical protein
MPNNDSRKKIYQKLEHSTTAPQTFSLFALFSPFFSPEHPIPSRRRATVAPLAKPAKPMEEPNDPTRTKKRIEAVSR